MKPNTAGLIASGCSAAIVIIVTTIMVLLVAFTKKNGDLTPLSMVTIIKSTCFLAGVIVGSAITFLGTFINWANRIP